MLDYKTVIDTLDSNLIKKLGEKSRYFSGSLEKAVWEGIDIAYVLELDKSKGKNILDIGCGAGWFLYVCKLLGHNPIGIDRIHTEGEGDGHHAACTKAYDMFGFKVYDRLVYPFQKINLDGNKFNIIVSNRSFFPTRPVVWTKKEWLFFFNDVKDNLVDGKDFKMFLSLNSGEKRDPYKNMLKNKKSKWGPLELEQYFHNYDATYKYKSLNTKRKCVKGNIIHVKDIRGLINLAEDR